FCTALRQISIKHDKQYLSRLKPAKQDCKCNGQKWLIMLVKRAEDNLGYKKQSHHTFLERAKLL
ncbi:hypothetical protein, partial [Ruegeria arenilitoris]|uniref:hypothetical protein n=1 Tax=Ruegeria arenilitoris TaxID=1173585 RepID=UPI001C2C6FE6